MKKLMNEERKNHELIRRNSRNYWKAERTKGRIMNGIKTRQENTEDRKEYRYFSFFSSPFISFSIRRGLLACRIWTSAISSVGTAPLATRSADLDPGFALQKQERIIKQ